MVLIQRNTTNKVVLTLSELVTIPAPIFLFEFITDGNVDDSHRYYIGVNLATDEQKERFDLFEIIESDSGTIGNANNEEIKLTMGQYTCKVYQSEVVTFDPLETLGLIKTEFMRVVGGVAEATTDESIFI